MKIISIFYRVKDHHKSHTKAPLQSRFTTTAISQLTLPSTKFNWSKPKFTTKSFPYFCFDATNNQPSIVYSTSVEVEAGGSRRGKGKGKSKGKSITVETENADVPQWWTPEEEYVLTAAWCATSKDELRGNGIKKGAYNKVPDLKHRKLIGRKGIQSPPFRCRLWVTSYTRNPNFSISKSFIVLKGFKRTRPRRKNPQLAVDSLANLTNPVSFNASRFTLPGSILNGFGLQLQMLQVLELRFCQISGAIPSTPGNLSNLHDLYLSGNSLTHTIPSTLGQLSNLLVLDLSRNSLTGLIPSSFRSLSNLSSLDMSLNYLSGIIP
ncbi:uncharacterized protein LOC128132383 [Lactuca sativa]|uniref:uncharacterized protein LOC128132383 n=1 Tax=Lactuca sativa TaxID=4236 RepID=UPI0022AE8E1C|nr:uncharacterized protein LOC128132383 [Lactuca sativa]